MKLFKSNLLLALSMMVGVFVVTSCGKDDDGGGPSTGNEVVASYQFAISETNFLEVTFSNFSQNADSYSWNFGDGNSSTEESPVHTYAAGGDYEVTLTATSADDSKSSTKTITITDPNSALGALAGSGSKIWKLSRNVAGEEYPLQVGPSDFSQIWWAYGLNAEIGSRPCLMEEEYIFSLDGTYTYNTNGMVYAESGVWNADIQEQCIDDTDATAMSGPNGEDLLPWGGGSFTYDYDVSAGTLTVNGLGAHIGLAKVGDGAEVTIPQNSVTYDVISIETDGAVDKLVLQTTLVDAGGYWQFFLVSYDNPADEPELPGASPTAGFTSEISGNTVTFTNTSVNADSYSWDFGDGMGSSTEENPTYTYSTDGSYDVVMTATNADGSSMSNANIVISNSVFTAAIFNGGGSKTWKLNPAAGALAVGPGPGSSEWFATSDMDLVDRACIFDDEYIFDTSNGFEFVTNGDVYAEPYMGVDPAGCVMESMLPAEAQAWGAGSHTYSVTEASGDDAATITVTGTGAFIGLQKAFNGGEYAMGPPATDGSITYEVLSYINDGSSEILVITVDISADQSNTANWTFTLRAD